MLRVLVLSVFILIQTKPNIDAEYEKLLGKARIVGAMDVYLGVISADTTDAESIMNYYGEYGSDYSAHSIFGKGPYAGLTGPFSPFNWHCETPPKIYIDTTFVAYLTENELIVPRVSTYRLVGFLSDKAGIKGRAH